MVIIVKKKLVLGSILVTSAQSGGFNEIQTEFMQKYKDEVDTIERKFKRTVQQRTSHLSLNIERATRITGVATGDFNPVKAAKRFANRRPRWRYV